MKSILSLAFLIMTSYLFGQDQAQIESQRVAEANYKRKVSNGAFEKAIDEMQRSAGKSSEEKLNQVNDDFEFNFAEKQKFESKLNSLVQKKLTIENKINQAKSEAQKASLQERLAIINDDLEKLNKKLEKNDSDLKNLQAIYRNLNK